MDPHAVKQQSGNFGPIFLDIKLNTDSYFNTSIQAIIYYYFPNDNRMEMMTFEDYNIEYIVTIFSLKLYYHWYLL